MKSTTHILNNDVTINRFIEGPEKNVPRGRIRSRLSLLPSSNAMVRAYLRDLRAAEMTAWQMTGGDYLASR